MALKGPCPSDIPLSTGKWILRFFMIFRGFFVFFVFFCDFCDLSQSIRDFSSSRIGFTLYLTSTNAYKIVVIEGCITRRKIYVILVTVAIFVTYAIFCAFS